MDIDDDFFYEYEYVVSNSKGSVGMGGNLAGHQIGFLFVAFDGAGHLCFEIAGIPADSFYEFDDGDDDFIVFMENSQAMVRRIFSERRL